MITDPARAAFAAALSGRTDVDPQPAATHPHRPTGNVDQGRRGTDWPDKPRETFARFIEGSLRQ